MNPLELYWGATFLRGASAVLLLLGAERLLRGRLGPECRRVLWGLCLVLLVIPQMNFSLLPVKLDLSAAASPKFLSPGGTVKRAHSGRTATEFRNGSSLRMIGHFLFFHRRKIEAAALAGLPLPMLLLLLLRYLRCRKRVRKLPPVTNRRVLESWVRLLSEVGPLQRPVILLDSSGIGQGAALFGFWRRKLLLPVEKLKDLSDRELALLLEHEYHHCRSGDERLNMLALVIWALCWYNPFLHIARRKVRSCCELACDHALLRRHPEALREYGRLLLKFASSTSAGMPMAIGFAESQRELSRRIRLMTAAAAPRRSGWLSNHGLLLLLGAMIASPLLLVAVDVRPQVKMRSAVAVQPASKPLLPYLTIRDAVEYDAQKNPVGCWSLDYSDPFPAEKSELVLEFAGVCHRISLADKPGVLRLLPGRGADAPLWIPDTSAAVPSLSEKAEMREGEEMRLVRADRKMVYASVPGSASPLAFRLEVRGINSENLGKFRFP